MNAVIFAVLLASAEPHPTLVFVPEEETAEACFAAERISAVIAVTPSLRLVRGARMPGESLETTRARFGAAVAVAGTRTRTAGGQEDVTLTLARQGHAPEVKKATDPSTDRLEMLLRASWPSELAPLAEIGSPGAANAAALDAACRGSTAEAYAASGAAIGRAVRAKVAPPAGLENKTLGHRWAKASALARTGRCKDAVPILRGVVSAFGRGEALPIWRRAPRDGALPSAIEAFPSVFVAFENGRFVALDAASGAERWTFDAAKAAPSLADAGDGLAIAALEDELVALELDSGKVRWRVPIKSPAPEIAALGTRIFVAGEEDIAAIDRTKGEVLWRVDPRGDVISGPALAGTRLVAGVESALFVLDPETGAIAKKVALGEEVSAPLTVGAPGQVWVMVGGDQVVLVDPDTGTLKLRARELAGAEWPPVAAAERLVLALRRRDKHRALAYVAAAAKNGIERILPNETSPLAALPSFRGVVHTEERPPVIVARGLDGGVLWRVPEKQRVSELIENGELVLASVGSRVRVLEPNKGTTLSEVDFSEPIKALAHGPAGGAVVVESGAIYGFPSLLDIRPRAWLRDARLDLGQCHLELKDGPSAIGMAKQVLERAPDDLDALSLLAAATEKGKAKGAAERWLEVARAADPADPVQTAALRGLRALAGIEARLLLDRPILEAAFGDGGLVVLATDQGLEAKSPDMPLAVRWRKPGSKLEVKSPPFRVTEGKTSELVREGSGGRPSWTLALDEPMRVIAWSADYVVIAGTGEAGNVVVLRAATGERVWSQPFGARVIGAAIGGDRVLIAGEKRLLAVPTEGGPSAFELKVPEGEVQAPLAGGPGFVVASAGKLRVLDRAKGRVLGQIAVSAKVEHLVIAGRLAFAALADGALLTVDLDKGAVSSRVDVGRVSHLVESPERVLVVTAAGEVLVLQVVGSSEITTSTRRF